MVIKMAPKQVHGGLNQEEMAVSVSVFEDLCKAEMVPKQFHGALNQKKMAVSVSVSEDLPKAEMAPKQFHRALNQEKMAVSVSVSEDLPKAEMTPKQFLVSEAVLFARVPKPRVPKRREIDTIVEFLFELYEALPRPCESDSEEPPEPMEDFCGF